MKCSNRYFSLVFLFFLSACSSVVSEKEAMSDSSAANDTAGKDKLICKVVAPTGSRIGEKTCLTQNQWNDARQSARDKMNEVDRRSTHTNPDGG